MVLPIYRSPTTTDWARVLFCCVLHPILHEFMMTFQRNNSRFTETQLQIILNDPKMHYHSLVSMNAAFALEYILVMYRRMMIGCMIDPAASIVAVVLTALEEAIMRTTMVSRDNFFNRLMGRPETTGAELEEKVGSFICK